MDAKFLYSLAMKAMLGYWKLNVPSPSVSPSYLWNVFKTAFISRRNRYGSITLGVMPEDTMQRFETLYDELTETDQHPGTTSKEAMLEMAESFSH